MHQRVGLGLFAAAILTMGSAHGQEAPPVEPATSEPSAASPQTATESQELAPVVVTEQKTRTVERAQASKAEIPLLETPQAISVITAETIQERGITRLADALRGVAGVSRSSTYGYYDAYQIRGFDAAYGSVYLDGLLTSNVAGTNNELAGLEQVEVVKGPASMLYGSAPLGGIVNLVSKRPRNERFIDLNFATGSYDLLETAIDANAPLTTSGNLLGRMNLLFRDSDDFVRYSDKQRVYIAPSLTWNIQSRTSLTLLTRYERDRDSPWSPVPAFGTVLPNANGKLPIDFSINDADDQRAVQDQDRYHVGYVLDHEFSDALSFQQTLRYSRSKVFWNDWIFAAGYLDSSFVDGVQQGRVIGRYVYGPFTQNDRDLAVDSRLDFRIAGGALRHNLIGGIDYRQNRNDFSDEGGNFDPAANPLDAYDPDYSAPLIHDPSYGYSGASKNRQLGFYLQDHIEFGEKITLTLGGRYDFAKSDDESDTEDGETQKKFSPRIGATYQLVPGAALYASWSKSFLPQPGLYFSSGEHLPPETGRNLETGVKLQSADGKLQGMVSVFELTRQNVATDDPAFPGVFSVVTGEQRSRGFEAEGQWRPIPAWMISMAYTYLQAKVTKDESFEVGARLANVPRNGMNLYTEYVIPAGPLANLGVSLGFLYNGDKNATLYLEDLDGDGAANEGFTLPSYRILDAGLSYRFGDWQTRLNINNLLDERYYPDACCSDRVTPGEPRSWRVSVGRSF